MKMILIATMVLSGVCALGAVDRNVARGAKSSVLSGPYGIRIEADAGCEKGAKYILQRLKSPYLPRAVRYYGDPFEGKKPTRDFTVRVKRNDGTDKSGYTGPSWGSCSDGIDSFTVGLAKGSDKWEMDLTLLASKVLTVCQEDDGAALHIYVNRFVEGGVTGVNPLKQLKQDIKQGLSGKGEKTGRDRVIRELAPKWAAFEDVRKKHPTFVLDYHKLKNRRFAEGKLSERISFEQMLALLGEVTGEKVDDIFKQYGVRASGAAAVSPVGKSVPESLQECDFLLNKDFKKNAKYYLCLFSASWCPPCRREMPRLAKTYVDTLKADPDIELIHFSRDQNDEKALSWAKEHDVKFPVVKPKGGNPLNLQSRGIPHLFIVKADGTLVEEGHPMRIFTDEKIREMKAGKLMDGAKPNVADGEDTETVGGYTWTYRVSNGAATIVAANRARRCTISPRPKGHVAIPSLLGGVNVTGIGNEAFCECSEMTSVEIPTSVTEIGWRAFSECGSLTSVTIPSGVAKIRSSAFSGCDRLTSISVSEENENYASRDSVLFDKCKTTLVCYPGGISGSYVVPSGVMEIGANAFSGCKGLTSVTVSDSVTRIGEFAFSQSRSLSSVVLGRGVTSIGQAPFYWCSGLTSISVSEENGRYASLDGVLFDKDKKTLICCPGGFSGEYAIPSSVVAIGQYAFDSCRELTAVTIPLGVTRIDRHGFNYCYGLTSVVIPSSVKVIGDWAFCRALKAVTISEGVTSIGGGAFCQCSEMKSVIIPSSVTSIGRSAFYGCKELSSVTMCGEKPDSNDKDEVFGKCSKLTAIHVPSNCKSWAGMKEWQGVPLVFDTKAE